MSKRVQLRRGTTSEHSTFTGSVGEITVDTTKKTVVVHDGVTSGGKPLVKEESLGTAATRNVATSNTDVSDQSAVMNVGFMGLGCTKIDSWSSYPGYSSSPLTDMTTQYSTGFYTRVGYYSIEMRGIERGYFARLIMPYNYVNIVNNPTLVIKGAAGTTVFTLKSDKNTTIDSNGFIKNASPIVQLFADKIELNDEAQQQEITFEKLGVGDYLIKGSTGLSNDGWYIEQPKDANGNIYHAVVHDQLENGDISIKTYECRLNEIGQTVADLEKPIDIKENRFISLRLNELPQDTTAPQNPNIVDSEGNPAPSKYHYLENGNWGISDEDAELFADEKYQAYLQSLKPLTRRQFKLAMLENGLLDHIETL